MSSGTPHLGCHVAPQVLQWRATGRVPEAITPTSILHWGQMMVW